MLVPTFDFVCQIGTHTCCGEELVRAKERGKESPPRKLYIFKYIKKLKIKIVNGKTRHRGD